MYEFISELEIEQVVLEHDLNNKKVEDGSYELLNHVFDQISSKILLQIRLHLENNNSFKSLEKVYKETINFQKRYKDYLELDYNEDVPNENERDILSGVYKTVSHAISEFPQHKENPLEYERLLIVSTGLLRVKEAMNTVKEDVIQSFTIPKSLSADFVDLLISHLKEKYHLLYEQLNELVTSIVINLNDGKQRVELNNYVEFLTSQETMLKNFIYINLEIGHELQDNREASELTGKYIYPLRQLYQDIHTSLADITHVLKKQQNIKPFEIKNVDRIIETNIYHDQKLKKLIKLIEDNKNNTTDRIMTHINDELTKITTIELRKLKKESNKFELLSFAILELFEECLQCITSFDLGDIQNDLHQKIVKGVTDTLHLKYDSLKEKDSYYHSNKKESHLAYYEGLIHFKNDFEQECETYLEEAIEGSITGFEQSQRKFSKIISKQKEENIDYDLDYIKKDILFEIKTLEDLIHQSIDKLKSSNEQVCMYFVACVEKMYQMILSQLQRQDIKSITPKEHDIFNGKEQEILIAEEAQGFKKGEIIRTQNSGFIYEGRILVRASVIAAK